LTVGATVVSRAEGGGPHAGKLPERAAEDNREPPADYTLWISALGFIAPDGSALAIRRGAMGNTTQVMTPRAGDLQWILLPLTVPSTASIKAVIVCYQLSNARSFISQVRLSEESTPPSALVRHDDGADLRSTIPARYESQVRPFRPEGAITLSLRLNFADTADRIDIGAIGLLLSP
jgi:hypothetical protein